MIRGKCPACGTQYCGWALVQPYQRSCAKCGSRLDIFFDEIQVIDDNNFSIFDSYLLSLHRGAPKKTDPQKQ